MKKEYTICSSPNDFSAKQKSEYETNDLKFSKHPIKVALSYVPNKLFLSNEFIRCFGTRNYYDGWTSGIRNKVLNFKYSVQRIAVTRYYLKMEKKVERNRKYQPQLVVGNACSCCGRVFG